MPRAITSEVIDFTHGTGELALYNVKPEPTMSSHVDSPFLRRLLVLDATISGASAILLLVGTASLSALLSVPASLVRGAGLVLVPWVALLVVILLRPHLSRVGVGWVIGGNAAWVAASLLILLDATLTPNALGYVCIIGQAVAVAALADIQFIGLRRATAASNGSPSYSAST